MVGENLYMNNIEAVPKLWEEKDHSLVKLIGIPPLKGKQYDGTVWAQDLSWI